MNIAKRVFAFLKNRPFRVDILTIFLILLVISMASIRIFSYSKTAKTVLNFSQGTIHRVGQIIAEKMECMVYDFQKIPVIVRGLVDSPDQITYSNTTLVNYFLNLLQHSDHLSAIYISSSTGNLLSAFKLSLGYPFYYQFHSSELLPAESVYAVQWMDRSIPVPRETWIYFDQNLKQLAEESSRDVTIDPLERPWYQEAIRKQDLFWSMPYEFQTGKQLGISASLPYYNTKGEAYAVIGVDLPFISLSQFLAHVQTEDRGYAYVLNDEGKVLVAPRRGPHGVPKVHDPSLVNKAYLEFKKNEQMDFSLRYKGATYLVSCRSFPTYEQDNWFVFVISPLKSFFSEILQTQRHVNIMCVLILAISSLCIVYFSKRISKPIIKLASEVDRIKHLDLSSEYRVKSHIKEINMIDYSIYAMRIALRMFEKFVPKEILKRLMQNEKEVGLGGEKKEISIFFSDVAGFTHIAEKMDVDSLMPLLDEYLDQISTLILNNEGTIDKYMGVGVMAFWGAPVEQKDHAVLACRTALLCKAHMLQFNIKRRMRSEPIFHIRIGINTGYPIVGNIGTHNRMNYTVVGDAVNTASRIHMANKGYGTQILISEAVYAQIGELFLVRPLDFIQVVGRKKKTKIYELVASYHGEDFLRPSKEEEELCRVFTEAYKMYMQGDLQKALHLFQEIAKDFPEDPLTILYLKRIQEELASSKR